MLCASPRSAPSVPSPSRQDNMLASFTFAAVIAALVFLAWCAVLLGSGRNRPDLPSRLPRSRLMGEAVGVPVLCWAAYHVTQMVMPGSIFAKLAVVLVPVVAVAAWSHLDYLFARAFGGLLLLGANHLLTAAFVVQAPGRSTLSVLLYAMGVPGLVLVSSPWGMRNLLEKARDSGAWRGGALAVCAFYAALFLGYAAAVR